MKQYHDLLRLVLETGERRQSRGVLSDGTKPDTLSIFGTQSRYDLRDGFPLVTTKKMGTQGFVTELLWFLTGSTNIRYLVERSCRIWDQWADENGELGPVYGKNWRRWESNGKTVDQISVIERGLRDNPFSRRHILSAWNVGELEDMALPPCHLLSQFYVSSDGHLDCQLYQRSADLFLGVPWNIACYSLLTELFANSAGLKARYFVHTIGDAHIYDNHVDVVKEQLTREPLPLPYLKLDAPRFTSVLDVKMHQITIKGYRHHGKLSAEVAV